MTKLQTSGADKAERLRVPAGRAFSSAATGVVESRRYVGLPDDEDDFDFNERFTRHLAELKEQMQEEERLNVQILENLKR